MYARQRPVLLATLVRAVGTPNLQGVFPDYAWGGEEGLRLADDYTVSWYRSKYRGEPCYVIEHSRTDYIFTEED
jgi:hypothetical protein